MPAGDVHFVPLRCLFTEVTTPPAVAPVEEDAGSCRRAEKRRAATPCPYESAARFARRPPCSESERHAGGFKKSVARLPAIFAAKTDERSAAPPRRMFYASRLRTRHVPTFFTGVAFARHHPPRCSCRPPSMPVTSDDYVPLAMACARSAQNVAVRAAIMSPLPSMKRCPYSERSI